jgi:hypothetical protein
MKSQFLKSVRPADAPPWSNDLTSYDREHFPLYMRLLSAVQEFTPDGEICANLFGIDAVREPERAQKCLSSHLTRALWLTNEGRHLLIPKTDLPATSS